MVDLCAGIGGIRRGFEMAGPFHNVLSAEIDPTACKVYEHLYGENPQNDLTSPEFKKKMKKTDCDILMAGFPCQTFSRAGKKAGFEDENKGIIFFSICDIIKSMGEHRPKCLVLENVDNLLTHDKGRTFEVVMKTLVEELNYHVIGAEKSKCGKLEFLSRNFLRNSKNFGVPQNRPRIFIIAFDKKRYGNKVNQLPLTTPEKSNATLYNSLTDLLDKDVDAKYFLSSGYLATLEKHAVRERNKGNGFGYKIVNAPGIKQPVANTLLATGGSGRERNLIYDKINGKKYAGKDVQFKKSPVNAKCIRTMTPNEWGKLQGFVDYAFKKNGRDKFTFPDGVADLAKYKLFGNAVTVPSAKSMGEFVLKCFDILE